MIYCFQDLLSKSTCATTLRRPGESEAYLSKLDELMPAHLAGGGGADGLGFDIDWRVGKMLGRTPTKVGRCRSTISKPELIARLVSAISA